MDVQSGTLGATVVVKGALLGKGNVSIAGRLEGRVEVDGEVAVVAGGHLAGDIQCAELVIEGSVRGQVRATGGLHVREGGALEGDVTARRVAIDDGGLLQGDIAMDFGVGGEEVLEDWPEAGAGPGLVAGRTGAR